MKSKYLSRNIKARCILWLMTSTFLLQINYLGLSYKSVHGLPRGPSVPDNNKYNISNYATIRRSEYVVNPETIGAKMNHTPIIISWNVVGVMTFIFVVAPVFTLLFVWFLRDQPLSKQCVANHLYRDMLKIGLLVVWLWTFSAVIFKVFEVSGKPTLMLESAKYIALINEGLHLFLFLYMFLVATLRLFTAKFMMLDPLAHCFGDNDDMTISGIRLILCTTVMITIGIICATSTSPLVYYLLIEQSFKFADLSWGTCLLFIVNSGICAISTMLHIATNVYQNIENTKLKNHRIDLECQNKMNNGNDVEDAATTNTKASMNYLQSDGEKALIHRSTLPYLGNGLIIILLLLLSYNDMIHIRFWWCMAIYTGIQGILIPIWLVIYYPDTRLYCGRQVQYYFDDIVGWTLKIMRCIKKRSTKVVPTSEDGIKII